MTLSDRVVVMNEGRVQQVAPPEEVYARPANRFVAGFIGEPPMDFFDCTIVERGGRPWAETDGFALALSERAAAAYEAYDGPADGLELGIRPEDFEDASLVEAAPDARCLDAVVLVVEPVGPAKDLSLRPVGLEDDESAEFTARVSNDTTVRSGDAVRLVVDVDEMHLFDRRTGENIVV
jgi:multiple sugar transport system ATP-binding protein